MGRRQPGNYFTSQSLGAEDDAVVLDRNHQVMNSDLPVSGGARTGQEGNLIVAQTRPVNHISNSSFGQMRHLGKDQVVASADLFFSPQMPVDAVCQFVIRMTEPAQEQGAGGPESALQVKGRFIFLSVRCRNQASQD